MSADDCSTLVRQLLSAFAKKDYEKWFEQQKDNLEILRKKQNVKYVKQLDELRTRGYSSEEYNIASNKLSEESTNVHEGHRNKYNKLHRSYIPNQEKFKDKFYLIHVATCYGAVNTIRTLTKNEFSIAKRTACGISSIEIARKCKN